MKAASPALQAILSGGSFIAVDLYTITEVGGTVHRYTPAQVEVTYNGNVYLPTVIDRDAVKQKIGISVDTCNVRLSGGDFCALAVLGAFDYAAVDIRRAYTLDIFDLSAGALPVFSGRVAEATADGITATLAVNAETELLNVAIPRHVFQPGCINNFCDINCGLVRSAHTSTRIVQAGSTSSTILLNTSSGFDINGVLTIAGVTRTITGVVMGGITISPALASAPTAGTSCTVFHGCARTEAACTAYGNSSRYRGQARIPTPATSI